MNKKNTTIIICCAGMGTRLGIGVTKALVNINGKPLIIRLLEQLKNYDDIRIVVGYQSEKVIDTVNKYRKDIMYAFNNDYENNGPAASMWKALINTRDNIILLDGDIVVEPNSFKNFLEYDNECIAFTCKGSDEPIYLNISNEKIESFSTDETKYKFPGIIKIKTNNIAKGSNYIYETIEHNLPIAAVEINAMVIDTQDDYENVIEWIKNNFNRGEQNEK